MVGPSTGQVDSDITCAKCDYNLRTLPRDGKCPECGLEVAESIDQERRDTIRFGPPLASLPARWLFIASAGFVIYLIGAAVHVGNVILHWSESSEVRDRANYSIGFIAGGCIMFGGSWCMTRASIHEPIRYRRVRRAARIAFACYLTLLVVLIVRWILSSGTTQLEVAAYMGSSAIATTLCFSYLSTLARRFRSRWLQWTCRVLAVLSLSMLWSAMSVYFPNLKLPLRVPAPEVPILGSIWSLAHMSRVSGVTVWAQYLRFLWVTVLWLVVSTSIMMTFAVMLVRIAAGQRQRSAASSRP
jgi:hypothetical protein